MKYIFDTSKHNDAGYILQWAHDNAEYSLASCEDSGENFWEQIISDGIYKTVEVKSTGGYGEGPNREVVFAICKTTDPVTSHHDSCLIENAICYFQIRGHYSSYEGTEWHRKVRIVKPQLTTTVLFRE